MVEIVSLLSGDPDRTHVVALVVEDLNTRIVDVGHVDLALAVHCQAVGTAELALLPPGLPVTPIVAR